MLGLARASLDHVEDICGLHHVEARNLVDREYILHCVENYPGVVALADGLLAGFVICNRFAPDILEIANMRVSGDFRRKGIGRMLVSRLREEAAEKWSSFILVNSSLYSQGSQPLAVSFYLKLGFSVVYRTANSNVMAMSVR